MKKLLASLLLTLSLAVPALAQSTISQGGTGLSTSTVGDLLVGTSSLRYSRLPVGASGTVLQASSTSPFRMAWVALSSIFSDLLSSNNIWTGTNNFSATTTINKLQSGSSAGVQFFSNSGSQVADFGAGGGDNASFLGGVNITGNLLVNTNALSVNSITGNVGIGTTTPTSLLSVASSTASGTSRLFSIGTSSEIFTVLANGNVGISTINPSVKFHVTGSGAQPLMQIGDYFNMRADGVMNWGASSMSYGLLSWDTGKVMIGGKTGIDYSLLAGNAERMRITAGGNVGIGTTSPVAKLDLYENVTNSGLRFSNTGASGYGSISAFNAGGSHLYSLARRDDVNTGDLSISAFGGIGLTGGRTTSGATSSYQMYINSSGNVGIGTTTPSSLLTLAGINSPKIAIVSAGGGAGVFQMNGYVNYSTSDSYGWTGYNGYNIIRGRTLNGFGDVFVGRNDAITILGTNGNVGIGTTTPGAKLDIAGDLRAYGANGGTLALFKGSAAGGTRVLTHGNGDGLIRVEDASGAARVQVSPQLSYFNTGNVGIGTTTPTSLLSVAGSFRLTGAFSDSTNASGTLGQVLQSTGTSTMWVSTSSLGISGGGGSGNSAWTIGNGVIYNATTSDNVGVGTTTPTQRLNVFGNLLVSTSSTPLLFVNTAIGKVGIGVNNNTGPDMLRVSGSITSDASVGATTGFFNTLSALTGNKVTFLGDVGIGTTSPLTTLDVNGTITQATVKSCTLGLTTDASGSITGCVVSDKSMKKNIKTFNKSIDDLMKIRAVTYKWKDTSRDTQLHSGFIAQEVAKVLPEAVVQAGEKLKGVDPNAVLALVVKSLQDLVVKVSGLEERINAQQEEIDELREMVNELKRNKKP